MELKKATRNQVVMKMTLQGLSSSGKSLSALLIAKGMSNGDLSKCVVIDTENSIELYSHIGNFNVLKLSPPFSPQRYIEAIKTCEDSGMRIIIIDSISHCWNYLLQAHATLQGNSFTNWQRISPIHNAFVQRIMDSSCHIICTIRSKQDYLMQTVANKTTIEKVGLRPIQRIGIEYDFTTVFEIGLNHQAKAIKDRSGLFLDLPAFTISESVGQRINEWCNPGHIQEDAKATIINNLKISQNENFRSIAN